MRDDARVTEPESAATEPEAPEVPEPSSAYPKRRTRNWLQPDKPHVGVLRFSEDIIMYVVAVVLVVAAAIVLAHTGYGLLHTSEPFDERVANAVNGVLFAIIAIEVMRTVLAHFEHGGFQLQPFLIIGIISAVREILTIGARLSLEGTTPKVPLPAFFDKELLALSVSAVVVVLLAFALVLIRRYAGLTDDGLGD